MKKQAYALCLTGCMLTIISNAMRVIKYNDFSEFLL